MKRARHLFGAIGALAAAVLLLPSRAEAGGRKCVEVSDVVGDEVCTHFGDHWSIEGKPPITFRFGFRYAQLSTEGLSFKESFDKEDRPKDYVGYRFGGEALSVSTLSAYGGDGGFTIYLFDQLYTGVEGGLMLGSARTATFKSGSHTLSNAGGVDVLMLHAGLPVGYRVPLGRASIRGEVLFGGVLASVSQLDELDGKSERKSAQAGRWLVESRIAADIWFTQHLSFGAYAGLNVIDSRGTALGLSMTWHARAFDGDMSLW